MQETKLHELKLELLKQEQSLIKLNEKRGSRQNPNINTI